MATTYDGFDDEPKLIYNLEESRFKYEADKSIIYDSVTNDDICNCYDEQYVELLINLLNKHYENL